MINWAKILLDGSIISLIASVYVMVTLWLTPRIWIKDFPQDIQALIPPKNEHEKRLSLIIGIPFLGLLFFGPFLSALTFKINASVEIPFYVLFLHALVVTIFFNVVDWLILDWLFVCTITPKFLIYPGTEGAKGYKDYKYHFIGFLKGSLFSVASALVIALILLLF